MFAMTPETIPSIEEAPDAKSIGVNKAQISVEEIVKSFECIGNQEGGSRRITVGNHQEIE